MRHETLLELFRLRPDLAVALLSDLLGVPVPAHDDVRLEPGELGELVPTEYRADAVVVLGAGPRCALAVVVEVQLSRDRGKRLSWPVYLAHLRARLGCPVVLLVVCVDVAVARWCAGPIAMGHPGWVLEPLVLGPEEIPVVTAPRDAPAELAVLSAMAHGGDRLPVVDALVEALATIPPDRARMYAELVLVALPEAARHHLEELMALGTFEYQSDYSRRLIAQGRGEGLAEGQARAKAEGVLTVLDARGMTVPAALRDRITSCRDLDRLDTWLRRAATVASAAELDPDPDPA